MRFAYYNNLSRRDRSIYRQSDSLEAPELENLPHLRGLARDIEASLETGKANAVTASCNALCSAVIQGLNIDPVRIQVRARRPSSEESELHGLYELAEKGARAEIHVWMKTAAKGQVVAFRSFLRTLLHELCHHLDYTLYALEDSFHTEGFFRRENALFKQLVPTAAPSRKKAARASAVARKNPARQKRGIQLALFDEDPS
jgi:hypothetical protein